MAKAHVLDTNGATPRVCFHITTPAGNNSAGIAWAPVLVNSGLGGTTPAAEKTDVQAGSTYEVIDSTVIPSGLNQAQANAFLDALHAAKVTEVQADIQKRLPYFGFVRT